MDDLLSEFLTETNESIDNLDVEIVRLEQDPNDPDLLSGIFRLVHTIKGTCGFLGLPRLESVAHAGENILVKFRDGELSVTPDAVTLILESLDAIKSLLAALAETETEPEGDDSDLIARLNAMANGETVTASAPVVPEGVAEEAAEPEPLPAVAEIASEVAPDDDDSEEISTPVVPSGKPLIELVGGISAVDAAVEIFYRKIMKEPEIASFCDGAEMMILQGRQVEFFVALLGGPDNRTEDDNPAHKPLAMLPLSEDQFEAVVGFLTASLAELEVSQEGIDGVVAAYRGEREKFLAAEAVKEAEARARAAKDEEKTGETKKNDTPLVQSIRVNVDLLENLMTMVSELVLSRNQLLQMVRKYEDSEFTTPLQRLSLITTDLQEGVMKTRMQQIGSAWSKLPRIIRDLSIDLDKKIELEMIGADTELDRQVLEMIKDPLTHMVRNSGDHGIEGPAERKAAGKTEHGTIRLNAYHEGGHIIIEIADDGRGINLEKVTEKAILNGVATAEEIELMSPKQIYQFIFKAGFSTAEKVTNVSGRGVGMDVVRTNIEKIGGHVELQSEPGKGSKFIVKIPLTLAIVSALIVDAGGERFAIPQLSVNELVRVSGESEHRIESVNGTPVLRLRDRLLPLVALTKLMDLETPDDGDPENAATPGGKRTNDDETFIVVCHAGTADYGIIVDQVFESEEIVVKPVTPVLREIDVFSGNTILGDGSVIMILDPNGIADSFGEAMVNAGETQDDAAQRAREKAAAERTAILIFRADSDEPRAVPLALVARLEEIDVNTIEETNGTLVVQYRGKLMPLIAVSDSFKRVEEGRQHVVVFSEGERSMGLMVDEIIDIVEDRLKVELGSEKTGVLGTAVIAGNATEMIDTGYYLERAFGDWFRARGGSITEGTTAQNSRVLLVDDSPFFRNLLTPLLSVAGYEVTAVDGGQAALSLRDSGVEFDVIVSDLEMPGMNGFEFAERVRDHGFWENTPLLALSSFSSRADIERGREVGFHDYIVKLDREALLESLSQTLSNVRSAA
jgi:two-component system, chemotaxis family, sensor kinase CheA